MSMSELPCELHMKTQILDLEKKKCGQILNAGEIMLVILGQGQNLTMCG